MTVRKVLYVVACAATLQGTAGAFAADRGKCVPVTLAVSPATPGDGGEALEVSPESLLSAKEVTRVEVAERKGVVELRLTVTPDAGRRIADYTGGHLGQRLAIVVDGKLVQAPLIRAAIAGGKLAVSGMDRAEADRLAARLDCRR
jgi:preprotein translocase subunit SecD